MTARKLQFAGALFDGRSSQKHPVDVELTPQEIILKEPGHDPVRWVYSHLLRVADITSPFHIEHRVDDENGERTETLVVEDPDFYANILKVAPESFFATQRGPTFNWKFYFSGALVLVFSAILFIKVAPSFLADQMVDKIPVAWEVAVGQSILNMLPVEQKPDPKILTILQDTVDLLAQSVKGNQPYDLKVYILPAKQANALAHFNPVKVFTLNQLDTHLLSKK